MRESGYSPLMSSAPAPDIDRMQRDTPRRLVAAAAEAFNTLGFDGTDTNRIARSAGFAPQTFYRWFTDKTDIFIRVYEDWQRQEAAAMRALIADAADDSELVRACVAHHAAYLMFRRSLRRLAIEDPRVRAARAESRLRQIEKMTRMTPGLDRADLAARLLQIERLADALAEGEFADMGFETAAAEAALGRLIRSLREPPARA